MTKLQLLYHLNRSMRNAETAAEMKTPAFKVSWLSVTFDPGFTAVMAAVLSSSGLAVSLSGIGVMVGAPLAGIAGWFGFISTTMKIGSKKLNKKITKHEKTISLAEAKHLLINKLISKAFNDGSISDVAFDLITIDVESWRKVWEAKPFHPLKSLMTKL